MVAAKKEVFEVVHGKGNAFRLVLCGRIS